MTNSTILKITIDKPNFGALADNEKMRFYLRNYGFERDDGTREFLKEHRLNPKLYVIDYWIVSTGKSIIDVDVRVSTLKEIQQCEYEVTFEFRLKIGRELNDLEQSFKIGYWEYFQDREPDEIMGWNNRKWSSWLTLIEKRCENKYYSAKLGPWNYSMVHISLTFKWMGDNTTNYDPFDFSDINEKVINES